MSRHIKQLPGAGLRAPGRTEILHWSPHTQSWEIIKENSNQLKERGIWLDLLYRPETPQEWKMARPPGTWGGNSGVARNVGPSSQVLSEAAAKRLIAAWLALIYHRKLKGSRLPLTALSSPRPLRGQPAHLKLWVHCLDWWALLNASRHFVCVIWAPINGSHSEHI